MRLGNIIFSSVHFLVVFFIFSVGIVFFLLPHAPALCALLTTALSDHPQHFQYIGMGILIFGGILTVGLYFLNRRRYLQLKMKGYDASVEESVVRAYVQNYFEEMFPDASLSTDVVIKGKKQLEVLATLPTLQEDLLETIQNELGILLHRRLGYHKDFLFTIRFA